MRSLEKIAFAGTLACALAALSPSSTPAVRENPKRHVLMAWTVEEPPPPSLCPAGMIEVQGDYCTALEVVCKVEDPKKRGCIEYQAPTRCTGATVPMRYCIDEHEHPNLAGEKPLVMQSWHDADALCSAQGKRLCKSAEWTLACEGPERLPYPYGYARDASRCNVDRPWIAPNDRRLESADREKELARLDGRVPSGSMPCISPYGVRDLTGNVDEWTTDASGRAALKGGNWGPYRNACRPATTEHAASFRYYQTGFRCCADLPGEGTRYVVAAIGDSLTDTRVGGGRYLKELARQCPESRFDAYGVGGQSTRHMRNRFAADLFGPRKPRYTHVIVMGGTNDLGVDYIDAARVKNVEDNLAFMYAMAQARGVTVIAVTVPPHSNVSERTEPVNRWIREQGHPFIDLATRMACGAPDILCPEYRKTPDDRVHWSPAGHALVAAELRKIFSDCR